ncbi:MAG: lysophospholipid acyltransferase family protein [Desulfobacterales bacterium]
MLSKDINREIKRALMLGRIIGTSAYLADIRHRRIVRRNLRFAFPDWTLREIRQTTRHVFHHLGTTFVEVCQLAASSREDLTARVRVIGSERWGQALSGSRGLIIVSAHLGNWEVGMQYAACFMQKPALGVAKKIRFHPLNQWVHNLRTRFGNKIVYKKGALPNMRQALRDGGVVAMLVDQSKRREGVDVQFFGHKVPATPAAAFLAIRCKSPVLPIFCTREGDGRLAIHVDAPLDFKWSGDLRTDVQTNTQLITDAVERAVRKYPEQWLWAHKRWKKYYPHLYPEYRRRRERRKAREERRGRRRGGVDAPADSS